MEGADVTYSDPFDPDVESFVPKVCAQLPDAFYSPVQVLMAPKQFHSGVTK